MMNETKGVNEMTKAERIDCVTEAVRMVEEARDLVKAAIDELEDEQSWDAYLMETFRTLLGGGNPYDQSLPQLLDSLRGEDEEERDRQMRGATSHFA